MNINWAAQLVNHYSQYKNKFHICVIKITGSPPLPPSQSRGLRGPRYATAYGIHLSFHLSFDLCSNRFCIIVSVADDILN